jgi:hypothetical protein
LSVSTSPTGSSISPLRTTDSLAKVPLIFMPFHELFSNAFAVKWLAANFTGRVASAH